jgi:hypothetical protein
VQPAEALKMALRKEPFPMPSHSLRREITILISPVQGDLAKNIIIPAVMIAIKMH